MATNLDRWLRKKTTENWYPTLQVTEKEFGNLQTSREVELKRVPQLSLGSLLGISYWPSSFPVPWMSMPVPGNSLCKR